MSLHKLFSFHFVPLIVVSILRLALSGEDGEKREIEKSFFVCVLGCNIQVSSQGQATGHAVTCENIKLLSVCMVFFSA